LTLAAYSFSWHIFWKYLWPPSAFHDPLIEHGLIATVYMSALAQLLGTVLGVVGALLLMSRYRAVRAVVKLYVLYFRGTPRLVQLALLYFGLAAVGVFSFNDMRVPGFTIPGVIVAGIIGLGVNEGAYMTEIVRAGILSIERGQADAAKSIGMTFAQSMRWVILPQAARVIVPPLGNEFNSMIKDTTLVVIIGGTELFNAYQQVNGVLFRPFELFLAVSMYYLVLTGAWTLLQTRIERRLGVADAVDSSSSTFVGRWLRLGKLVARHSPGIAG
jgi:polar amino acid transport system permease protein